MYHVYISGSKQPVWSYHTMTWLRKRLDNLCALRSVKTCRVEYECFGKVTEVGQVDFNQRGYAWHIDWQGVK